MRAAPRHVVGARVPARSLVISHVKSQSAELTIGMKAPHFKLNDVVSGRAVSVDDFAGSPLLVMFLCVHCPYVVLLKEEIVRVAQEYGARGFKVVAISSNSTATHPQDGPDKMKEDAAKYGFPFPYLFDESQEVAQAYTAACTPEFYVFDAAGGLAYHGQFDDARPKMANSPPVTGRDLRAAMDAVLAGKPAPKTRPSIGCNIKWAPGKEPTYFGAQVVK